MLWRTRTWNYKRMYRRIHLHWVIEKDIFIWRPEDEDLVRRSQSGGARRRSIPSEGKVWVSARRWHLIWTMTPNSPGSHIRMVDLSDKYKFQSRKENSQLHSRVSHMEDFSFHLAWDLPVNWLMKVSQGYARTRKWGFIFTVKTWHLGLRLRRSALQRPKSRQILAPTCPYSLVSLLL